MLNEYTRRRIAEYEANGKEVDFERIAQEDYILFKIRDFMKECNFNEDAMRNSGLASMWEEARGMGIPNDEIVEYIMED